MEALRKDGLLLWWLQLSEEFILQDAVIVLILLCNFGAFTLTNAIVIEELNNSNCQLNMSEANPFVKPFMQDGYTFLLRASFNWVAILGFYWYVRSRRKDDDFLWKFVSFGLVALLITSGLDFLNDYGYYLALR